MQPQPFPAFLQAAREELRRLAVASARRSAAAQAGMLAAALRVGPRQPVAPT